MHRYRLQGVVYLHQHHPQSLQYHQQQASGVTCSRPLLPRRSFERKTWDGCCGEEDAGGLTPIHVTWESLSSHQRSSPRTAFLTKWFAALMDRQAVCTALRGILGSDTMARRSRMSRIMRSTIHRSMSPYPPRRTYLAPKDSWAMTRNMRSLVKFALQAWYVQKTCTLCERC